MSRLSDLGDRVAVVTGAASGIGRATGLALADAGCHLALADLDEAGLAETARAVEARGRRASRHRVDVADRARMERFAAEVEEEHGAVHVLVNNAGIAIHGGFADHDLDDLERLLDINLRGVILGCKLFLPALERAGAAHIVNVSSLAGLVPVHDFSAYCASKFAVRGFSESIRMELAPRSIGVTVVHPGMIRTNIPRAAKAVGAGAEHRRTLGIRAYERFGHPPERVARAIVRAIRRDRARALVGWESYLLEALKRIAPVTCDRLVGWAGRKGSTS